MHTVSFNIFVRPTDHIQKSLNFKLTTAGKLHELAPAKDVTGAQEFADGSYRSTVQSPAPFTPATYNLP